VFTITDQEMDGLEARTRGEDEPSGQYNPMGQPEPGPAPALVPVHPEGPSPVAPPPGDTALRRGAAKGLLWATAGLVAGGLVAGPLGAAAGVVGVGAIRNTLRAKSGWADPDPEIRAEAGKSATMAIFGLGIAGMLGYYAWQRHDEYADED
jgi:hypothetical protein